MKSNKGLTLVSLIIYLIVLSVVIGTMSTLTKYFYRNSEETLITNNTAEQYSRLIAYITDDINLGKIKSVVADTEGKYIDISFTDNTKHQYLYEEEKVYFILTDTLGNIEKYITLCNEIEDCEFLYEDNKIKTRVQIKEIIYNNSFSVNK